MSFHIQLHCLNETLSQEISSTGSLHCADVWPIVIGVFVPHGAAWRLEKSNAITVAFGGSIGSAAMSAEMICQAYSPTEYPAVELVFLATYHPEAYP